MSIRLSSGANFTSGAGECERFDMKYVISEHAEKESTRRKIPRQLLDSVMQSPQQVVFERAGRKA
jgi:hypothetical protein